MQISTIRGIAAALTIAAVLAVGGCKPADNPDTQPGFGTQPTQTRAPLTPPSGAPS